MSIDVSEHRRIALLLVLLCSLQKVGSELLYIHNKQTFKNCQMARMCKLLVCVEISKHEHNKTKQKNAYFHRFQDTVGNS